MEFYLMVLAVCVIYYNLKDPVADLVYDFLHRRRMKTDPEYRRFMIYTEALSRDIIRMRNSRD